MHNLLFYLVFTYVLSALAVFIWDKAARGTYKMSWVESKEIFMPVYNTIMAIQLWIQFNPFKGN